MSEINDGGPVFPCTEENGLNSGWSGMDLRDYFAAKAMAMEADEDISTSYVCKFIGIEKADYDSPKHWPMYVAKKAYAMADAMIKVRQA